MLTVYIVTVRATGEYCRVFSNYEAAKKFIAENSGYGSRHFAIVGPEPVE